MPIWTSYRHIHPMHGGLIQALKLHSDFMISWRRWFDHSGDMCGKSTILVRIRFKNNLEHKNSQGKQMRYEKDTEPTPVKEDRKIGCYCSLRTAGFQRTISAISLDWLSCFLSCFFVSGMKLLWVSKYGFDKVWEPIQPPQLSKFW